MPNSSREVLFMSVREVLDSSTEGRGAAQALQQRFEEARQKVERLPEKDRPAKELEARMALEEERERLRFGLIKRAGPLVEALRVERKAAAILDRDACIVWDPAADVTAEVIKRLNAAQ